MDTTTPKIVRKRLSHPEWISFIKLAQGEVFDSQPKGKKGVYVSANIDLWKKLGY